MADPLYARDLPRASARAQVDDAGYFSGYASVFSVRDGGGDIVEPGAFTQTLAGRPPRDIRLLWQHDPREPIGVLETVKQDERGLYVEGRLLLEIERAKALHLLIKAGALDALSIGYKVRKARSDPKQRARLLTQVDLWEVSFVTFPMQALARLTHMKSQPQTTREFETFLREAGGFSKRQAAALAGKGFGALSPRRDAEDWNDVMSSLARLKSTLTFGDTEYV